MCACTFLGIKYIEYSHKVHEHILFGRYFDPCVSPGGAELLTKNNECPGTKSTVEWDYGDRQAAASRAAASRSTRSIRTRTSDGVQADCKVTEVKRRRARRRRRGRAERELASADHRAAAPRRARRGGTRGEAHEGATPKFPCWRPAYQPAVCPDLDDRPSSATHGAAARPQVGILVEYGDHEERGEDIEIKAECKAAAASRPTAGDIVRRHAEHARRSARRRSTRSTS